MVLFMADVTVRRLEIHGLGKTVSSIITKHQGQSGLDRSVSVAL